MAIDFNQPSIVAGIVAAVVSLTVAGISQVSGWVMHGRRIAADRDLAERKFKFDSDLAERKVNADIALAEKKLVLDQELALSKRRHELAEQALAVFYQAKDALDFSRSRMLTSDEGKSLPKLEGESEKLRERRELYFIPIERLNAESDLFSRLFAMRYSFAAHFGQSTAGPFNGILQARNQIVSAATILIQTVSEFGQDSIELRNVLGWGPAERPNKIDHEITSAVAAMEEICRPVLSQRPSS
jgi:hypothetical protein